MDIIIDMIDNKTFREVQKFINDKLPEGVRESVTPKSSKRSKRSSKESGSSESSSKKVKSSGE